MNIRYRISKLWTVCVMMAAPVAGQTVYLRTPGTPFCKVTGASAATPIRVTFSGSCGLVNGATIIVNEVRGNTAANVHLDQAGDTAGFARKVANLAGNQFDLMDLNGNPVNGGIHASCSGAPSTYAGTCAYSGGGRIGLVTAYTLRAHPILFFDGPSGSETTRLLTNGSGAAVAGNVAFNALLTTANYWKSNFTAQWGKGISDMGLLYGLSTALKYKIDGDTVARDAALFDQRNPDQLIGATACDELQTYCGGAVSTQGDYPMHLWGEWFYQAYTLLYGELTPAERAAWVAFMLADRGWQQHGLGYTSASPAIGPQPWKILAPDNDPTAYGTVSSTFGSTTLTGTGTNWLTSVAVGDIISWPHAVQSDYSRSYKITAIVSDTELTLSAPAAQNYSGVGYQVGAPWNNSYGGFLFHQKHAPMSPLNGGSGHQALGNPAGGDGLPSPFYPVIGGLYSSMDGNAGFVHTMGQYALGMVTCSDDPRGCLLASQAYEIIVDQGLPFAFQLWTGFSTASNTYHLQRVLTPLLEVAEWTKNSFAGGGPDLLAGSNIRTKHAEWLLAAKIPGGPLVPYVSNQEAGNQFPEPNRLHGVLLAIAKNPTGTVERQAQSFLLSPEIGYSEAFINSLNYMAPAHYVSYDHQTVPLAPSNTTMLMTENSRSACLAHFDLATCNYFPDVRSMGVSRKNWTVGSSYLLVNASGFGCRDHCQGEIGGYHQLLLNGKPLLGGDSYANMGNSRSRNGYIVPNAPILHAGTESEVGYGQSAQKWYPSWDGVPQESSGNNDYLFMRLNLTGNYLPIANVASVYRDTVHLKSGSTQDYLIDRVVVNQTASQPVRSYEHYNITTDMYTQTRCGLPASTPCVSFSSATQTASLTHSTARLNSAVYGVGTGIRMATDSGNDSDGSYTGGAGYSFRWYTCPSGDGGLTCANVTSAEWFVVHQPAADTGAVMPEVASLAAGAWRGVQISDPLSAKVLMLTTPGTTAAGPTFTTTHAGTGQYLVAGLPAGSWMARRNGGAIVGGPVEVSSTGGGTFSFASLSGEIAIIPGPPPFGITTVQLPHAVLNRPYQATLETVSGVAPITWEISAGSLCTGLSLTPGGATAAITGTPTALTPCTFTVRAQDAAISDSRSFTIVVEPLGSPPLQMITPSLPVGRIDDSYLAFLAATGGNAPYTWSVTAGQLCAGLTLEGSAGRISGVLTAIVPCVFTLTVRDLGNFTVDRVMTIVPIVDGQSTFRLSFAEASHSAAVLRFGRRGMAFDQSCAVELRAGGPGGALLSSIDSPSGASRREVVATGLAPGTAIHASAVCGANSAVTGFETAAAPGAPVIKIALSPPTWLASAPGQAAIFYGASPALGNALVIPCTASGCVAEIIAADPLLYWKVEYREAGGAPLAVSAIRVRAPR